MYSRSEIAYPAVRTAPRCSSISSSVTGVSSLTFTRRLKPRMRRLSARGRNAKCYGRSLCNRRECGFPHIRLAEPVPPGSARCTTSSRSRMPMLAASRTVPTRARNSGCAMVRRSMRAIALKPSSSGFSVKRYCFVSESAPDNRASPGFRADDTPYRCPGRRGEQLRPA